MLLFGCLIGYVIALGPQLIRILTFMAPGFAFTYYSDAVFSMINSMGELLADQLTISIGFVGVASGMLGLTACLGLMWMFSAGLIALTKMHEPARWERVSGSILGAGFYLTLTMLAVLTALLIFPRETRQNLDDSDVWPYLLPVAREVYPAYRQFAQARMGLLTNGLSNNRMLAELAVNGLPEDAAMAALDELVGEVRNFDTQEVQKLMVMAKQLEPAEIERILVNFKSGEGNVARIEQQIREVGLSLQ